MKLPKVENKPSPEGYINLAEAVRRIGSARLGDDWRANQFVERLPFHVGTTDGSPTLDTYVWESSNGVWEPNSLEYVEISRADRKEARQAADYLKTLTNDLFQAVESGRIGLKVRNVNGDHAPTKSLKGLLVGQAKFVRETGRIRIRHSGSKDQLAYVYFEEKAVARLARGHGAHPQSDAISLTADQAAAMAKELIIRLMQKAEAEGILLRRDDIRKVLQATPPLGLISRSLFENRIWKRSNPGTRSWFEQQNFKKLQGRQPAFRQGDADEFIARFLRPKKD